jgi:hypothetical protein
LLLLSTLGVDTPYPRVALYAFTLGAGLGMTMQTITTAVQNAVERRDMGAATSSTTFFRSLGGSLGVAVFGTVLANRLAYHLGVELGGLPAGAAGAVEANNVQAIQALAEPVRHLVLAAFAGAIDDVFRFAVPLVAIALAVACVLPEVPLRGGSSGSRRTEPDQSATALAAGA